MDQDALQWHFALQTYGLPRPDRAGWFVIYRALGRQCPGMPSFLTIPVGDTTTVQSLLDAIEGGWQDLRLPGQVIPWRVSVIDTFRARSRNRVLESPTMVLIPLVSFADFEQRPLLELVFPLVADGPGGWSSAAKPHNADALENFVFNLFGDRSQAGAGGLASYFPGMSR